MLSLYVSSERKNWDAVLPYLTSAYNTAMQSTTKYSQFRLLYGREPMSTLGTIFPYSGVSDNITLADAPCRFEECRQIARTRTADTQAAAKLRYDEQPRHVEYSDGALVWLWIPIRKPGLAEKRLCQCVGPYRVEPVTPPADRRCRSTEAVHVSRLKSYVARSLTTSTA